LGQKGRDPKRSVPSEAGAGKSDVLDGVVSSAMDAKWGGNLFPEKLIFSGGKSVIHQSN
jgi:hypothetical protein